MVLTGSCPCPGSWPRAYGAHLHLQAREDPIPTALAVPSAYPMTDIAPKTALRNAARGHRATLARAIPDFAQRLAGHSSALEIPPASLIGAYVALPGEADPHLLLEKLSCIGCAFALPRVVTKETPLSFHHWNPGQILRTGAFGIAEPSPDWPVVQPQILFIPLLAFDARGYRLGYGGGFYDRTLDVMAGSAMRCAIGVAYAGQEIDRVPNEPHDLRLDMVVTETGVRRFGNKS